MRSIRKFGGAPVDVALAAGLSAGLAMAEPPVPNRAIRAMRVEQPPAFDGLVDEGFWAEVEPATGFIQRNPDEGEAATEATEVRFAFDDKFLYIGIVCFDSRPESSVQTQNRRDGEMDNTDSIQILLDTFNDGQNAFIFGTTPTGIEFDAQVSKAGQDRGGSTPRRAGGGGGGAQRGGASAMNINWDGFWEVRAQPSARGWEAEMAIPFRTLRFRPGTNLTWGLNIFRTLRRRNEQSFWAPVSRAFEFTQIALAGTLGGIEASSSRNLKLLPYVVGGFSQDYRQPGDQSKAERGVGLDVKYGLTPSLTLDATVNTDFAQVEVDDEQVNLTRFDLFFPEKRPFFLENSGFFEFGSSREVELFFSRRIGIDRNRAPVPIDVGARVSGKAGPYQIGLLNMQTREADGRAPANNYAVARFSRELPNRSSIGLIGTNRQSMTNFAGQGEYNRAFGADANIGLGRFANWFNYVAKTKSPGLETSDHAAASFLIYDDAINEIQGSYRTVGRNFNPEIGFVNRVGYNYDTYAYKRRFFPRSDFLRSFEPHFSVREWRTIETGDRESDYIHFHFVDMRLQSGGRIGAAYNSNFERLDRPFEISRDIFVAPGRYRWQDLRLDYNSDPTQRMFWTSEFTTGGFYDGTLNSINVSGGYRRGPNVSWIGSYVRNFVRLPAGDFNTDLIGLRFNWSFTSKSFVQTLSQYNSAAGQIGHNIRFTYQTSSSTGLFVVFNTAQADAVFNDPHGVDRRTLSRALIVKFNHLLDF